MNMEGISKPLCGLIAQINMLWAVIWKIMVRGHMQEDLVVKLASFGFTVNQAKVYLSIVQSGKTRVGRISRGTQLHRQDIYKLLPKLEKMGLITKTIDKPFMIEAIPIDKALETLISKEKDKANERISHLENNLKEMITAIQLQPETKEEARFTLLTSDEAIKNRGRIIFKKPKKDFKIVASIEHITKPALHYFREFLQLIANHDARLELIIVTTEDKEEVKQTVEKIAPGNGELKVKFINKSVCKNYQVIDNKEVWIATQQKTETGFPCLLWTNDSNIVDTYRENFQMTWTNPKANVVTQTDITQAFQPYIPKQINNEKCLPAV
jgi:sugar-specific transcriptional regulator TrmB